MSRTKYKSGNLRATRKRPMSSELEKQLAKDAGKGVSQAFEDSAWWLSDELLNRPWIEAIAFVDRTQGKKTQPLIELLRSKSRITSLEREYLVDLLERHQFNVPAIDLR